MGISQPSVMPSCCWYVQFINIGVLLFHLRVWYRTSGGRRECYACYLQNVHRTVLKQYKVTVG